MSGSRAFPRLTDTVPTSIVVVAIIATYLISMPLLQVGPAFAAGWLPASIGLASLVVAGPQMWLGVLIGTYCAARMVDVPLDVSLLIAVSNTAAALTGRLIFRMAGFRTALDRFRDVVTLMAVTIPTCGLVSALGGVVSLQITGHLSGSDWFPSFFLWWQGSTISSFIVAPLILSWIGKPVPQFDMAKGAELAGMMALTIALGLLSLTPGMPYSAQLGLVGSTFPLIVWATLRFDLRATTILVLLIIGTAMAASSTGLGPLRILPVKEQWSTLSVFAFFFSSAALILGVLTEKRRRVESALRASQQRLTDIADSATDFFWETDRKQRITFVSDRLPASLGGTATDLIGLRLDQQKLVDVPEMDLEQLASHIADHKPFRNVRITLISRGGSRMVFALSGQPVVGRDGDYAGYRGAASDITDQLRGEDELLQSLKLETVSKLTGGVAHEFNNLLAVIVGNLELSIGALSLDNKARPSMERALGAADRAATLIHRLLAYSRRQALQPRVTDANNLIESIADVLQHTIDPSISIELELEPDAWPLKVDPAQLEMAIMNLSLNAAEAMPDGGELIIETYNAALEHPEESFDGQILPGDYLTINVRDTGTGITADVIDRMFEPFFTTKEVGEGSGLGLSMVHGFVNQSGGHLDVASAANKGATITLLLPRYDGPDPATGQPMETLDVETETT